MKKLFSILLVAVMVLGSFSAVFADTNISVAEGDSHEYDVYQIFTGDLSGGVLINVKWGKNGTGTEGEAVDQAILDTLDDKAGTDAELAAFIA